MEVNFQMLRNIKLYSSKNEAVEALRKELKTNEKCKDGTMILARYKTNRDIKYIFGIIYNVDEVKSLSIFVNNRRTYNK